MMKIAAVTACPSGVAHTYMAAEALREAGRRNGVEVVVETQGAAGIDTPLTEEDIRDAVCIILSNDVKIRGEERFAGKKILRMDVNDLMEKAGALVKKIRIAFS